MGLVVGFKAAITAALFRYILQVEKSDKGVMGIIILKKNLDFTC